MPAEVEVEVGSGIVQNACDSGHCWNLSKPKSGVRANDLPSVQSVPAKVEIEVGSGQWSECV